MANGNGMEEQQNHLERFSSSLKRLDCDQQWMNEIPVRQRKSSYSSYSNQRPRYQDFKRSYLQSTSCDWTQTRKQQQNSAHWSSSTLSESRTAGPNRTMALTPTTSQTTPSDSMESFTVVTPRHWANTRQGRMATNYYSNNPTSSASYSYLGWRRSSDNLHYHRDSAGGHFYTPQERLAVSMLPNAAGQRSVSYDVLSDKKVTSRTSAEAVNRGRMVDTPNCQIHDSIKSVTSAIIQYCGQDQKNSSAVDAIRREKHHHRMQSSRNIQPKILWMESSFVSATAAPPN